MLQQTTQLINVSVIALQTVTPLFMVEYNQWFSVIYLLIGL